MDESKRLVIYHGDCLDGFCAAWCAWRSLGDSAEYVPAMYGQDPPDVTGRDVYIVDFSYKRPVMERILEQAAKCVVLDHHKTAEADLAGLAGPNSRHLVLFDMQRSGAGMARDYFQPGFDNWLVDYTQDRDLWRFALPGSKLVNAYIGTLPQTFEAYERASALTAADAERLGVGADAYKTMYVEKLVQHARRISFAGYDDVPIVNAPYVGISDVVGALAETALFAVGWFQRGDGRVAFSLRSRGDFDVSALAQRFGGGGHKNAAGFTVGVAADQFLLEKAGIVPTRPGARLFELVRDVDETGVSGTGKVAEGIYFSDGTLALRWTTHSPSTAVYQTLEDAERVHGHGGKTRFVFDGQFKGLVEIPKPHLAFGFEGEHADDCIYHNCGPALPGARMAYDKLGKILAPPGWTAHACWCVGGEVHLRLASPSRYLRTEQRAGADYESRYSERWEASFMITKEAVKNTETFGVPGAKVAVGGVEALSRRVEHSTCHQVPARAEISP